MPHMALIMFVLGRATLETQTKEAYGVSLSSASQEAGWAGKKLCGCFDGRVLYGIRRQQGESYVTSLYKVCASADSSVLLWPRGLWLKRVASKSVIGPNGITAPLAPG